MSPVAVSLAAFGASGGIAALTLAPGTQVPFSSAQVKTVYSEKVIGYAYGGAAGSVIRLGIDTAASETANPNICEVEIAGYLIHQ